MTRTIAALADRLLELASPRSEAVAVCRPPCSNIYICCRYSTFRFRWYACNSSCDCWWGDEC